MKTTILALGAAAAAALAAPAVAADWSSQRISWTQTSGLTTTGAQVGFLAPGTWTRLKPTDSRHLSFHRGTASCRYSITFTTRIAADRAESAEAHVLRATPVPSRAYLLDAGTRNGIAAWRVTRLKTTDGTVRLLAMQAVRRSLGPGRRAWHETVVTATSRKGDECHSGTYRQATGPQIGTALASADGRIYTYARRN
jgi:opacity protein-like surface antigen